MEIADETLQTTTIDHLGLIAAICKDLKIIERIDRIIYKHDSGKNVTPGESVVAMILNGLGFVNRRLYLTPQFFSNKPTEELIASGVQPENLTYDTLASSLDDIYEYGPSRLFSEVAMSIAAEHSFCSDLAHLDSTSISVEGLYEKNEDASDSLVITYGHSKDHRPDLKQFVMSLVVTGESRFPLWMEVLNGNSSDKSSFHDTIKKVRQFQSEFTFDFEQKWVADSALYSKEKLLKNNDISWLTRVPETLSAVKALVLKSDQDIQWADRGNGYKTACFKSDYGDIQQRWLLVFTQQGYDREIKTLEKKLDSEELKIKKELRQMESKVFNCVLDAEKAISNFKKRKSLFTIEYEIVPVEKYLSKGRPTQDALKEVVGYQVQGNIERSLSEIERLMNAKGRFVLATNDLDEKNYPDEKILADYKEQQKPESCFRFLKDPWFMLDSVYLKNASRVSALMMIMSLCLMVYNVAEYKLRRALREKEDTLPNQKGKEISNPTLKWIFQMMEGINIVRFIDPDSQEVKREVLTNLNENRSKIIQLFGETACKIYGLIKKSTDYPLRI